MQPVFLHCCLHWFSLTWLCFTCLPGGARGSLRSNRGCWHFVTVIFKNRQAEYFKVLFWAAESLDQSDFKTTPDLPAAIKMGPPEQPRNRAIPDVQFDQHRSLLSVCSLCLVRKLVMPPAVEAKGKQLHHTGGFFVSCARKGRPCSSHQAAICKVLFYCSVRSNLVRRPRSATEPGVS